MELRRVAKETLGIDDYCFPFLLWLVRTKISIVGAVGAKFMTTS